MRPMRRAGRFPALRYSRPLSRSGFSGSSAGPRSEGGLQIERKRFLSRYQPTGACAGRSDDRGVFFNLVIDGSRPRGICRRACRRTQAVPDLQDGGCGSRCRGSACAQPNAAQTRRKAVDIVAIMCAILWEERSVQTNCAPASARGPFRVGEHGPRSTVAVGIFLRD